MKRSKAASRTAKQARRENTAPPSISNYARKKAARTATGAARSPVMGPRKQSGIVDIEFIRNVARVMVAFGIISIFVNMARMF